MNLQIQIINTPDKFRPMAQELVPPLVELLRGLAAEEAETMRQDRAIREEKRRKGIPVHQGVPEQTALFKDHEARYGRLVQNRCTPQLLAREYGRSYGEPGKYDYLNTECRLTFTMKSSARAVVETFFSKGGLEMCHQFILRDTGGGWKISEVNYGFQSEPGKWHKDHI